MTPKQRDRLEGALDEIRRGLVRNQQILRKLQRDSLESRERMNRCHDILDGLRARLDGE
jgi:flagellin-specific chaperone FliS